MAVLTSQQIARYFELFNTINVTFTKDVIAGINLIPKQIYLKCLGDQWPCIIYSTSFVQAKVIANVSTELFEKIRNANNLISLRFAFKGEGKKGPIAFFVSGKITGFTPYSKDNKSVNFISIDYTQRPPDDLITIIGRLLEANINSKKRKEERIDLSPDTIQKLGIKNKTTHVQIDGIPRKCILRDISFSGAKVIVPGIAKFLVDKSAQLFIEMDEIERPLQIQGKVLRYEEVAGRKDLAALGILFDDDKIPAPYKIRLSDYFNSLKKGR
ncbi:MAG: PilZ domain-containing protein [Spirochaetales bacterium]|nr:PilZ domain-containing protein [Spirochaetales bacterium]